MMAAVGGVQKADWDAVIVGASLAGCSTAIALAQAGARVAVVERQADPAAFKRICGHLIHPSARPALKRLGLLECLTDAGAARTRLRMWTRWGWIHQSERTTLPLALNIRREVIDPLVRAAAADLPGVELLMGHSVTGLSFEDGRVTGVEARTPDGRSSQLRGQLVVGADGRGSRVAKMAGHEPRKTPHARFSYAAYFDERGAADPGISQLWMMDPQWAARFPTDSGLTIYACMPTKDRLPEFKRDLAGALHSMIRALPDPPPIDLAEQVAPVLGKVDMPNLWRGPTAPGLALVGDAALATDPIAGVGCGWAFEGGARLGAALAPALLGSEPLERGLRRYKRRHVRALALHSRMIHDYANGRPLELPERTLFAAGARDARVADDLHAFAARVVQPERLLPTIARAVAVNARNAIGDRLRPAPPAGGAAVSRSA